TASSATGSRGGSTESCERSDSGAGSCCCFASRVLMRWRQTRRSLPCRRPGRASRLRSWRHRRSPTMSTAWAPASAVPPWCGRLADGDPEHRQQRADPERRHRQRAVQAMSRMLPALAIVLALAWPGGLLAGSVEINGGTGSTYTLHLTTFKEAKFRNTVRQKYDFSCGSAAVATLLTYQYGYPVTEQAAFAQMYAHGDRVRINKEGFSLLDIKSYLQTLGFEADGFRLPLDKLAQE